MKYDDKFMSRLHSVSKENNENLLLVIKQLDLKGETEIANFLDSIRIDNVIYDYYKDNSGYYEDLPHHYINQYTDYQSLDYKEKLLENNYARKRMQQKIDRFAFTSITDIDSSKTSYTLKEKLKYYSKRIDDTKLTPGQRKYAFDFIANNQRAYN